MSPPGESRGFSLPPGVKVVKYPPFPPRVPPHWDVSGDFWSLSGILRQFSGYFEESGEQPET
eukprot:774905-Amorphochlora_amoeboformis.AAC.1